MKRLLSALLLALVLAVIPVSTFAASNTVWLNESLYSNNLNGGRFQVRIDNGSFVLSTAPAGDYVTGELGAYLSTTCCSNWTSFGTYSDDQSMFGYKLFAYSRASGAQAIHCTPPLVAMGGGLCLSPPASLNITYNSEPTFMMTYSSVTGWNLNAIDQGLNIWQVANVPVFSQIVSLPQTQAAMRAAYAAELSKEASKG